MSENEFESVINKMDKKRITVKGFFEACQKEGIEITEEAAFRELNSYLKHHHRFNYLWRSSHQHICLGYNTELHELYFFVRTD